MAKDPSVSFYTSDFLSGTTFFTDEQCGQYIRLLCHQHQLDLIPEYHMISVCKTIDSPVIKKFIRTSDGFYYNERMKIEKEKRVKYCESRRHNNSGRPKGSKNKNHTKTIRISYGNRMENENENENDIEIENKVSKRKISFKKPTLDQVKAYCKEINAKTNPEYFFNNYESTGWIKANGQKIVNWKSTIRTWESRNKQQEKPKGHQLL